MYLYLLIGSILFTPFIVRADGDEWGHHMMNWQYWGGFGMFIFPIFWLIIIGLVVGIFYQWTNKQKPHQNNRKNALDILKERYVKGEVSKEQFESMKKDISG